jgi:glutaredoxin 3
MKPWLRLLSALIFCSTAAYLLLYFNQPTLDKGITLESKVEQWIRQYPILIFSKSYCPYCKKAKGILNQAGYRFKAIELDEEPNGREIQEILYQKTQQKTVPNIFLLGKHKGGSSDLETLKETGELDQILKGFKLSEV